MIPKLKIHYMQLRQFRSRALHFTRRTYSKKITHAGTYDMNRILLFLLFSLLIFNESASAAPDDTKRPVTGFTILHTNDIHGHVTAWRGWEGDLAGKTVGGMDRLGSAIKQVRAKVGADNVLLLDAGDTLGDTMIADETKGKAIVDVMNALGYTAMVVGNHEPDFTAETLKQRISEAKFPVLAANITEKGTGKLFTKPYIIQNVNGIRMGILGLAYPNTALTTAKKNVSGLEYREAPPVAREYIPKMRKDGAQIVVVLSHYGLSADKKLAKQVPGIDIIVGGHSHNRMTNALKEGNTLIVQAGAHGSDLGRLDVQVEKGKIVTHEHSLITLDNAIIPTDSEIAAVVDKALAPHKAKLDERLGDALTPITRAQTIAGEEPRKRDQESPADSLFADIIRDKTQADVVILPGVGYGTSIPTGTINAADLRNLIPHESKVVTMTLKGAQLRDILEQSLENTYTDDPKKKVGGLVQFSEMTVKYKAAGKFPHRLLDVHIANAPLDLRRDYKVATNSLLAGGGHNYKTFLDGKNVQEGEGQYDMIKQAIQKRGKVSTPPLGRIEKIGGNS